MSWAVIGSFVVRLRMHLKQLGAKSLLNVIVRQFFDEEGCKKLWIQVKTEKTSAVGILKK